jgi:benzoate-CoA ligase family protein
MSEDTYDRLPRLFNAAARYVDYHVEAGRGERVALVCGGQRITYAEVAEGVNRCGNAFRQLGVRMEDRVVLVLLDSPEFVYAFWGAIKIGAVPVPTNTLLTPRDYEYVLDDSRAEVVVVDGSLLERLEPVWAGARYLRHVVVVEGTGDQGPGTREGIGASVLLPPGPHAGPGSPVPGPRFHDLLSAADPDLSPAPTTKDDVAFWLYTSGTTGTPKAAVHLQHDMVVCCEAFGRHVLEIDEDDRAFSIAKLFFAYGLGNALYYPFYVGASSVLHPERFDAVRTFEIIARERPTLFFAVPTAYAALLQVPDAERRYDLSSLRLCLSAGEPLPKRLYERWRERFGLELLDGIGSTEMCNTFIANRRGHVRPGSSGLIVPGYEARVIDEAGRDARAGEPGDLWVKGESACACYWNQHQRTKETIVGDWVRTGDRYSRDADGYYWYLGRSDDMIKAGGMWVSPAEVESALVEHDAVVEAGVVGAPDDDELVKPVAFVVLADGRAPSDALEQELKDFVKTRLAPFKYPRRITFVRELPKTATGKVKRFVLREMVAREAGGGTARDSALGRSAGWRGRVPSAECRIPPPASDSHRPAPEQSAE